MQPSFTIPLRKSSIHYPLWLISFLLLALTSLVLYVFIFFNAAETSLILMQSSVFSLTPADILWSHSFSLITSFSMYSFYDSLIPFSSTITLPDTPFRQFDLLYLVFLLPYILAYKSLPRIRFPKMRVSVWSKIVDPRISRRWFLTACTACKLG